MKKVLSILLGLMSIALLTGGFLVLNRYRQNPEQIVPYPYEFKNKAPAIQLNAPILITGDRMGEHFAKFKEELAAQISINLDRPINIQSMAKKGNGLHRTLHELRSISPWPQILIYQGASEEFQENKFNLSDISKININFKRYADDRLETLMVLWPWLSRVIYEPLKRISLDETPGPNISVTEEEYLNRLETELLLYEQQLIQLVNASKDRNGLLILTTTPINLDVKPHKVCSFTTTIEIEKEVLEIREMLQQGNLKAAYGKSSRLIKQHVGNTELYFLHGQIARKLGLMSEAKHNLSDASAYDCEAWRTTEVHNAIIRKVAKQHQAILFDFARLVENEYTLNTTFFDDIYPQNIYYDKAMKQLGLVIKAILKL